MDVRWDATVVVSTPLLERDFHPACSWVIADSCDRRRVDTNHIHSASLPLIEDVLCSDTSRCFVRRCHCVRAKGGRGRKAAGDPEGFLPVRGMKPAGSS